ncbi:hypothetical protein JBW_04135 [Pelosinus fermentans JBW45]|uniref:Uncharacterized protein n=1 Tax=Pelosinus fermentans JBW45 TaxID=1192197 RepID=I9DM46_9FIRM|nr:hypothetical protein JBW_04135 [Pelosinus fermentans JBW45]
MDSETTNQDGVLEIERRSLNEATIQSYKFKNVGIYTF